MDLDKVFDSLQITLPDDLVFMYVDKDHNGEMFRIIEMRVVFAGGRDTQRDTGIYHAKGRKYLEDGESSLDERVLYISGHDVPDNVKNHFIRLALDRATEHRLGLLLLAGRRGLLKDEDSTQNAPS